MKQSKPKTLHKNVTQAICPTPMVAAADNKHVACCISTGGQNWIVIGDRDKVDELKEASTEYAKMTRDDDVDIKGFTWFHAAMFNRFISDACRIPNG
jgi:hypothetical protein